MKTTKISRPGWTLEIEIDEDEGTSQAYLEHRSGESCSLACAEGTGCTSGPDEMRIPPAIVAWAVKAAEAEGY